MMVAVLLADSAALRTALGCVLVEAGIEKRFRHDKHDAILIRVVGNHERGLVPGGMMCGYEANRYCDSLVRQGYTKAWGCGDLRYWLLDRLTRKYKDAPDKYVSAYYKCGYTVDEKSHLDIDTLDVVFVIAA